VCLVRVSTARPRDHAAAAADRRTRARAMLLLFETPAGCALFKVKDEKKLRDAEVRAARGDDDATRRDATRARAKRRARSTRRRWDARRARGRRSTTRDARGARGATVVDAGRREGGRAGGRARTEGGSRFARELANWGLAGEEDATRGRGTDDARARERERRSCKMLSARWRGRRRWCR